MKLQLEDIKPNNLYTYEDTAQVFGTSKSHIYNLVSQGHLPRVKIGAKARIYGRDIIGYIDSRYRAIQPKGGQS